MSLYIELKNWNTDGDKTFLVHSFNAASRIIKKQKMFANAEWGKDPGVTHVVLKPGSYSNSGIKVDIAIGYEEFKKTLLNAAANHQIPSFNYKKKYADLE